MTWVSHSKIRLIISIFIFGLFLLNSRGYFSSNSVALLEDHLYDFRLISSMPKTVDERVVIVDIDEHSLTAVGHWPWPRKTLSNLVDTLMDHYHVSVLGFDMVFPEYEETSAQQLFERLKNIKQFQSTNTLALLTQELAHFQGDIDFASSIIGRNVVAGYSFDSTSNIQKGELPTPMFASTQVAPLQLQYYEASGYIANYYDFGMGAQFSGFFNYPRESEGAILRKLPLFYGYQGALYSSLALQMFIVAMGDSDFSLNNDSDVKFLFDDNFSQRSYKNLEYIEVLKRKVPIDEMLSVYVPYRGYMESFPYVSAIDVLNKTAKPELLEGKIVLLGTRAAGLYDLKATPVGDVYPGVEVHANVISALLDGTFKLAPPFLDSIETTLLLLFTVLLHIFLPRLGAIGATTVFSSCLLAVFAISLYLWRELNLVIPMANTILLICLLSFLHITYGFFVESRQKRRMNRFFGQYIPVELVKELDQSNQEISLSGESRDMSVLFSDVRGFTTISEGLAPKELTQLMNEFLTPITKSIHDNRGTIDKYMGDAVMAFWGAPLVDEQHANHAVKSAFELIDAMHAIKPEFDAKGWPEIKIGVGVSSGEMRVGNMGSEFRMAYTVLGDVVNLGSRLEGLTKNYGVDIIVSDETAAQATNFKYRELDRVRVKGKVKPVVIYEPLAKKSLVSEKDEQSLALYNNALKAYHQQDWQQAQEIFNQLKLQDKQTIYTIYLNRIADYIQNPPGIDWDGVFVHTSK